MDVRDVAQLSDVMFLAFRDQQRRHWQGDHGCNCGHCQLDMREAVQAVLKQGLSELEKKAVASAGQVIKDEGTDFSQ
ncbi:MAG: hypothetical protein HYT69_00285 [Candidatus Zambryskibacteria bacterium]|nr:hypothetical protein [Candidatus Zambryskibacteria bacterium]